MMAWESASTAPAQGEEALEAARIGEREEIVHRKVLWAVTVIAADAWQRLVRVH